MLLILILSFSLLTPSPTQSHSLPDPVPIRNRTRTPPPLPILPLPNSRQLQWQLGEMAMFLHFGPNTFTDSEWGTGRASPSVFNPTRMDPSQWVRVAKEAGFSRVLLTAKHHDGFCLWPTEFSDYSVRSSAWRNGSGDVVGELAAAAHAAGIGFGVYLSPWDRHEKCYGLTLDYNEFYMGQLRELLTWYGDIQNVFLDGAKGEGETDMEYYFDSWFSLIHQLQPGANIFSDAGPDNRWVGDELGVSGSTCWSLFNRSDATIPELDVKYLKGGDPFGHDWVPAECDVSIRPGWFWHAIELPKSSRTLLDMYYKSVGRNCHLLLNVPPNTSGVISDEDIRVLQDFAELRRSIFGYNLAETAVLSASSIRGGMDDARFSPNNVIKEGIYDYWAPEENQSSWVLNLRFQDLVSFNILKIQEPIHMGQRIIAFHFEAQNEVGEWKRVINGTTVGYQRLLQFPAMESRSLRFAVSKSRGEPLVSYLGIYLDNFSVLSKNISGNEFHTSRNGSDVVLQLRSNHSHLSTM